MSWGLGGSDWVDHFEVIRPLGRGSTAEVYLARDQTLGRKVALKVIKREVLGDDVERFVSEARATALFNHPNIVTIYAVGETGGRPYLALEYLEGESLRERIEREPPTEVGAIRIGLAIAEALVEAHGAGVLHRDLKPENVVMARDGRPRVVDFGLAGVVAPEGASSGETCAQGTPGYMAPEQWQGWATTGGTDVWALGVVLFEMLTGHRPVEEKSVVAQAARICDSVPMPRVDDVRPELADLIARCLDKLPAARPHVGDVANDLRRMLVGRAMTADDESPFRGLMPFHEEHRHLFYGRETEIAACAELLRERPMISVVGASGAGKSSLVRAGLIPRLRERGPLVAIMMRPGSDPFRALGLQVVTAREQVTGPDTGPAAGKLAQQIAATPMLLGLTLQRLAERRRSKVLLFVDQLEELVTLIPDENTRQAFLRALVDAADAESPVRVVVTLREEFLSRLAVAGLGEVTVLRPPGPEALRDIVSRPLALTGYHFDDEELPDRMVSEVAGEVACLPLLQFAGAMLWQRRDKVLRLIRRAAYDEMGGVAGALAQHADGVIAGMPVEEMALARSMLLRLVTDEGTRRVLSREQALDGLDARAAAVLAKLIEARLLVAAQADEESQVELVHESLMTAWGRLARWIDESSEELRFLAEIGQAAELWKRRGEREDDAWQGKPALDAEHRIERCSTEVPTLVRRFVVASRRKEKRRQWRRRALSVAAFAMLAVVAVVYIVKERDTRAQRDVAITRQALALREGAQAAHDRGDPLTARAMVRESLELEDNLASRMLWWRLSMDPVSWRLPRGGDYPGFSRDGREVALNFFREGLITIYDARTAEPMRSLHFPDIIPGFPYYLGDSRRILVETFNEQLVLFDATGEQLRTIPGSPRAGSLPFIDESGERVGYYRGDGSVVVFDIETGTEVATLRHGYERIQSAFGAFVGDAILAYGRTSSQIVLWSIETGEIERELTRAPGEGFLLVPLRHQMFALWSSDRLRVHDTHTGALRGDLPVGRRWIMSLFGLAMEADRRHLVVADGGPNLQRWDIETGEQVGSYGGDEFLFNAPDGTASAVITNRNGDAEIVQPSRMQKAAPARRWLNGVTAEGRNQGGVFFIGPQGDRFIAAHSDGKIRLWRTRGPELIRELVGGKRDLGLFSVSADGELVTTNDGLHVFHADSGEVASVLEKPTDLLTPVYFDPGGLVGALAWVVPVGRETELRRWDPKTGRLVATVRLGAERYSQVIGGTTIGFATPSGDLEFRDIRSGRMVRVLPGMARAVTLLGGPSRPGELSVDGGTFGLFGANTLQLTDLESGEMRELELERFGWDAASGAPWRFFITEGGRRAITEVRKSGAQWFQVWDLETGEVALGTLRVPMTSNAATYHPRFLAVGGSTLAGAGVTRIYDMGNLRPIWQGAILAGARLLTHEGWQSLTPDASPPEAWQELVNRARLGRERDGRLCVWTWDDTIEQWSESGRSFSAPAGSLRELETFGDGCVVLTGEGEITIVGEEKRTVLLESGGRIFTVDGQRVWVVTDRRLLSFTAGGRRVDERRFDGRSVDVLTTIRGEPVAVTRDSRFGAEPIQLRQASRFQPVRAVGGPRGTLVVGFEDGTVGLWDRTNGVHLHSERMHGSAIHLVLRDQKLFAASELGDHLVWDLGVLFAEHCALLKDVWKEVEVAIEGSRVVVREPPAGHPCPTKEWGEP